MKHANFTHTVEPQHCDAQRRLPMPTLISWLIEAASEHAESRGFGYTKLRSEGTAWVLARLAVEIKRAPKAYNQVLLTTWVDNFNRLFSTRNFSLTSPSSESEKEQLVYGYVKSQWSMIDLKTRKVCDLSAVSSIADFKEERPCPITPPGKIHPIGGEAVDQYQVRYADIDVNRHMNTVKYIEHALNLFPLEFFDNHRIERLEVQFIAEAIFNDTLSFFMNEDPQGCFAIEIQNQNNIPINRLKITFVSETTSM